MVTTVFVTRLFRCSVARLARKLRGSADGVTIGVLGVSTILVMVGCALMITFAVDE